MKKNRGLIVLFTLLIQCMIIVAINHFMLSIEDIAVFKMLLPWVNLIVVIVLILTIYSIRQVEKDAQNRVKVELLKKHVFETESLNALLNSQKHEFSRHVQAIQSMVYVRRYDELKEYINAMAKEYRHSENLIKAGHSAIMTLINSTRSVAESQGIEFAVAIKCMAVLAIVVVYSGKPDSSFQLNCLLKSRSSLLYLSRDSHLYDSQAYFLSFPLPIFCNNFKTKSPIPNDSPVQFAKFIKVFVIIINANKKTKNLKLSYKTSIFT